MALSARSLVRPVCVDLDGTLVRSNLLLESLLALVKKNPLYILRLPFWAVSGNAAFKNEIAARVRLDPALLPYDREMIEWLGHARKAGHKVWLCTAANERLARDVAAHLGLFEGVLASDSRRNLAGAAKAKCLVEKFGAKGFEYCGKGRRDLLVWREAAGAIVAHAPRSLAAAAAREAPVVQAFPRRTSRTLAVLRALRPHQWAKNALIAVPLLAAHRAGDPAMLRAALLAVMAFCLCASAVYVLNDLLDLDADRAHTSKSSRPFAAGDLSIAAGLILAPTLLAVATALARLLPGEFQLAFASYFALTLAYSLTLKGRVLIDAMTLAGLYTLRIIAGARAVAVALSFWLLLFSVCLFLSLALVKRYAELDALRRQNRLKAAGRGYIVEDLPVLLTLGAAAGYLSVLVLALYINSPEIASLYRYPKRIWILCVLMLYWVSRIWMRAQRGQMHEDPVLFALRDRVSLLVGLVAALTIALAV